MFNKKLAAVFLTLILISLAVVPETLACHRRNNRYRAVAGRTYYNPDYAEPRRSGLGSKGRAALTVAAPAAVAAGVGALVGGKKGAVVGALIGGGSGAAYYLIKNRRRY